MKLVVAVVKPFKLDEVKEGLKTLGVHGLTADRGPGLRAPAGSHRGLPGCRVRGRVRAEDPARDPRRRLPGGRGDHRPSSTLREPGRSVTARSGSSPWRRSSGSGPESGARTPSEPRHRATFTVSSVGTDAPCTTDGRLVGAGRPSLPARRARPVDHGQSGLAPVSRSAGLAAHRLGRRLGRLGVAQVAARTPPTGRRPAGSGTGCRSGSRGPTIVVVADAVDVLAQGPQAVAVGHHQHRPAPRPLGQQVGHDGVLPVGERPGPPRRPGTRWRAAASAGTSR